MELLMRFVLLLALTLGGCFNIDEPPCAYACGPGGACPDDYTCGSDNYCHLHGTGVCQFSDASVVPDLAVPEGMDLSVPDLTTSD
jgi:hypothetical protein